MFACCCKAHPAAANCMFHNNRIDVTGVWLIQTDSLCFTPRAVSAIYAVQVYMGKRYAFIYGTNGDDGDGKWLIVWPLRAVNVKPLVIYLPNCIQHKWIGNAAGGREMGVSERGMRVKIERWEMRTREHLRMTLLFFFGCRRRRRRFVSFCFNCCVYLFAGWLVRAYCMAYSHLLCLFFFRFYSFSDRARAFFRSHGLVLLFLFLRLLSISHSLFFGVVYVHMIRNCAVG